MCTEAWIKWSLSVLGSAQLKEDCEMPDLSPVSHRIWPACISPNLRLQNIAQIATSSDSFSQSSVSSNRSVRSLKIHCLHKAWSVFKSQVRQVALLLTCMWSSAAGSSATQFHSHLSHQHHCSTANEEIHWYLTEDEEYCSTSPSVCVCVCVCVCEILIPWIRWDRLEKVSSWSQVGWEDEKRP